MNNISFFTEDISYTIRNKKHLKKWITQSIENESLKCGDINFIFCSDKYLLEINENYLQHFDLTDVITFDYSENEIVSGDIFLSLERIRENARLFHQKTKDEIHRIMIHGVLHLMGYHDKKPKEKILMTEKEDYYLSLRPEIR